MKNKLWDLLITITGVLLGALLSLQIYDYLNEKIEKREYGYKLYSLYQEIHHDWYVLGNLKTDPEGFIDNSKFGRIVTSLPPYFSVEILKLMYNSGLIGKYGTSTFKSWFPHYFYGMILLKENVDLEIEGRIRTLEYDKYMENLSQFLKDIENEGERILGKEQWSQLFKED